MYYTMRIFMILDLEMQNYHHLIIFQFHQSFSLKCER